MSVGEKMVENFDEEWIRMANGFGGGIAEALDVCGALVGAVMTIGALYGRRDLSEDQSTNWRLCREYHRRFLEAFTSTNCLDIRETKVNGWTHQKCAKTVRISMQILLEMLSEEEERSRSESSGGN